MNPYPVTRWMSQPVLTTTPAAMVEQARALLAARGVHHLVVVEADEVVGVICGCDLKAAPDGDRVKQWMSASPVLLSREVGAERAAEVIIEQGVGCLPVVEGRHVVGVFTRSDARRCALASH